MRSATLLVALILYSLVLALVDAHAVLLSPAPRDVGTDRLQGSPCGQGLEGDWRATSTTVAPGPLAVTFRETINHPGAPYRIALSVESDGRYDDFVLLDHVPHNDDGTVTDNGGRGKYHRVVVNIPDINCAQCALQLVQVLMQSGNNVLCENPSGLSVSCGPGNAAYFSCANIVIRGTQPASTLQPLYTSLDKNSNAHNRTGYGSHEAARWIKGRDGYWQLPFQASSTSSGATSGTTSANGTDTTTATPFWKGPIFAAVIAGTAVVIILIVTIVFMTWRRRRNLEMAQPTKVADFTLDAEAAFDDTF